MRTDQLTVYLNHDVIRTFDDVEYHPTWNGLRIVTAADGETFLDNVDFIRWDTFTRHAIPALAA